MLSRYYAYFGIVIFLFYITYAIFNGFSHPIPALGDSWDYHIPISKMILSGEVITPTHVAIPQWYYPGSSEAINSLFLLFHIPLTLSNIFAVIVLFLICWKLGGVFKLNYYESIFFATTIVTLNGIVRWYNSVSIDVWLVNFFLLGLILLQRPKKSLKYFLLLGLVLGMLIGTKFTGFYYLIILVIFYGRNLLPLLSFKKFIFFLIPFTILGLSWYIRNLILFHNPFYPLYFVGLPFTINFSSQIWNISFSNPKDMLDAFFGEYKIWVFSILFVVCSLVRGFNHSQRNFLLTFEKYKLEIVCLSCFLVFLISPTDTKTWIMVSSMRYSYITFVLAILIVFLYCKKIKRLDWLFLDSITSMIMVTSFNYYPKLIFIYGSCSLVCCYLFERYKKKLQRLFR